MYDSPARRHPLHIAGFQHPRTAVVVFMFQLALQHEGDRLHPPVRMVGKGALPEPVFRHHEKRVEFLPSSRFQNLRDLEMRSASGGRMDLPYPADVPLHAIHVHPFFPLFSLTVINTGAFCQAKEETGVPDERNETPMPGTKLRVTVEGCEIDISNPEKKLWHDPP